MHQNIILNTDSYKTSHYLQFPPNTTHVSLYIESRGGRFPQTLFFGLQAFIKEYLCKPITQAHIDQAHSVLAAHGVPFNRAGWQTILEEHGGYLPISIQALPEGVVVPTHNVLVQITNTCPKCFWLPGYLETALLRAVWYPTTVATHSYYVKHKIAEWLIRTTGSTVGIDFALHDFGARGVSSFESASLAGMAHLLNFKGTDTISGILAAQQYYQDSISGFSIPAAEHSTITAWGEDKEWNAYENMLSSFSEYPVIAVVSDSYNLWEALKAWGTHLKEKVEARKGLVVIRLDSGNPEDIVTEAILQLMQYYGSTTNTQGYKELPKNIRVIQGDGISLDAIDRILRKMEANQLSAANVAFGMGGELLQKHTRDTQKFAMKASAIKFNNGEWQEIYKAPITDPNKRSKKGRLAFDGKNTVPEVQACQNLLTEVYRNGMLLVDHTFDAVKSRSHINL